MKKKNEAFVPKKNEPRGAYILHALEDHFLNGDAYTTDDEAIHICMQAAHGISYRQLRSDMDYLISIGKLVFEGSRLYLAKTKRYEDFAAKELAEILPNNNLDAETATIGLYVQLSSPSSCSARKKPRTSSSTLPAGCGREIACGSELFCSSVWRIVFKSRRNCSRCACWHSARQSQFVRCPAGMADRSSHACRCSGLSKNSVVPNRAVCGLSCMACYLRCQPLVCLRIQFIIVQNDGTQNAALRQVSLHKSGPAAEKYNRHSAAVQTSFSNGGEDAAGIDPGFPLDDGFHAVVHTVRAAAQDIFNLRTGKRQIQTPAHLLRDLIQTADHAKLQAAARSCVRDAVMSGGSPPSGCAKPETKSSPTSCREKNGCAFWRWMQRRSRSWRMFRERGAAGFSDRLHASGRGGDG